MPSYVALTYTADVDWTAPEQAEEMAEYVTFGKAAAAVIRGGEVLHPTAMATNVRVRGGKGGEIVASDGPYAETKEALTGFYLLDCANLDEAVAVAARGRRRPWTCSTRRGTRPRPTASSATTNPAQRRHLQGRLAQAAQAEVELQAGDGVDDA